MVPRKSPIFPRIQGPRRDEDLSKVECQLARLLLGYDLKRSMRHFGLDKATADRAEGSAVLADDHLRRLIGRNRAVDTDNCSQSSPASLTAQRNNPFVNVHKARPPIRIELHSSR